MVTFKICGHNIKFMKLSRAGAATIAVACIVLIRTSACTNPGISEPRSPEIEAPMRQEPHPIKAPEAPIEQDNPDGGPSKQKKPPGPYEPVHEELQTRLAMRP